MKMYYKRNIGLSNCQVKKLAKAIETNTPLSFSKYKKSGTVPVYLTKGQVEGLDTGKPIKFSKRQLSHMGRDGGFLGALLKLIGPAMKVIAPVAKAVGPAVATGALSGAASYGANKLLRAAAGDDRKKGRGTYLKPYKSGNGVYLEPYRGGSMTVELSPKSINQLLRGKTGGFIGTVIASLLPLILGSGISQSDMKTGKYIMTTVANSSSKKTAQNNLNRMTKKYGRGLLGRLFGLPEGKIPVLGDLPIIGKIF